VSAEAASHGSPPPVAVIVTNYNYARFVEAAIRSVAAQTYPLFRCVIVDDCSTDESVEIITRLLSEIGDPRFELFRRPRNGGQLAGMTDGLQRTIEPFVAFLDADDLWHPSFLSEHIRAHLNTARAVGFTSSDMALIDANGALVAGTIFFFDKPRSGADGRISAEQLPVNSLDPLAIAFRRKGEMIHRHSGEDVRHWSPTSALVFRRALLELIWPELHPAFRIGPDHYIPYLAHLVSGCLLISGARLLPPARQQPLFPQPRPRRHGRFRERRLESDHAAQDSLMIAHIQRRRADFERALGADRTMR
jgi:glycosyltransferase involved in cell wall biosynthesis